VDSFFAVRHQTDFSRAEMPELIQRMIGRRCGTREHLGISEVGDRGFEPLDAADKFFEN
jgi:hypothetical protein